MLQTDLTQWKPLQLSAHIWTYDHTYGLSARRRHRHCLPRAHARAPPRWRQHKHVVLLLQEVKMAAQSFLSESVLGWSIFTFILLVSECEVVSSLRKAADGYTVALKCPEPSVHGLFDATWLRCINVNIGFGLVLANISLDTLNQLLFCINVYCCIKSRFISQ